MFGTYSLLFLHFYIHKLPFGLRTLRIWLQWRSPFTAIAFWRTCCGTLQHICWRHIFIGLGFQILQILAVSLDECVQTYYVIAYVSYSSILTNTETSTTLELVASESY